MKKVFIAVMVILTVTACAKNQQTKQDSNNSLSAQEISQKLVKGEWIGQAVSYSGYRDQQSPDTGVHPTREQILEDLRILEKHWQLIRMYGAGEYSELTLQVIREEKINLKMMLGAWLGKEPDHADANIIQVNEAIRQANSYPDIVVAINVGNEALVNWSDHAVPEEKVIDYVEQVKAAVKVPVTVADNYAYWRDEGADLAKHLDFVTIHSYPLWERRDIDEGLSYTVENYNDVKKVIPDKALVIGEAGWATYTEGNLHVPRGGDEIKQKQYFSELMAWAQTNNLTIFWFEAFDEPWKGTGTEGHWGLFTESRHAKLAMREWYPDRITDRPTSPEYPDQPSVTGIDPLVVFPADLMEKTGSAGINPLSGGAQVSAAVADSLLRFSYDGTGWGGIYFTFNRPFDASSYKQLIVKLQMPGEITDLEIKIEGPAGKTSSLNLLKYQAKDKTGEFSIPLGEFKNVNLSRLEIIGFWNPKSVTGLFVKSDIDFRLISFE